MTLSTLLADLLWPLLILGVPLALFAAIGTASWPARERTPLTQWGWTDLYGNARRELHISSKNTLLGRLVNDTVAPEIQHPTHPPRTTQD